MSKEVTQVLLEVRDEIDMVVGSTRVGLETARRTEECWPVACAIQILNVCLEL